MAEAARRLGQQAEENVLHPVPREAEIEGEVFRRPARERLIPDRTSAAQGGEPGIGPEVPEVGDRIAEENEPHGGQVLALLQLGGDFRLALLPVVDAGGGLGGKKFGRAASAGSEAQGQQCGAQEQAVEFHGK